MRRLTLTALLAVFCMVLSLPAVAGGPQNPGGVHIQGVVLAIQQSWIGQVDSAYMADWSGYRTWLTVAHTGEVRVAVQFGDTSDSQAPERRRVVTAWSLYGRQINEAIQIGGWQFAATDEGVFVSKQGFVFRKMVGPNGRVFRFAQSLTGMSLYAVADDGLWLTEDGQNWQKLASFSFVSVQHVVVDPFENVRVDGFAAGQYSEQRHAFIPLSLTFVPSALFEPYRLNLVNLIAGGVSSELTFSFVKPGYGARREWNGYRTNTYLAYSQDGGGKWARTDHLVVGEVFSPYGGEVTLYESHHGTGVTLYYTDEWAPEEAYGINQTQTEIRFGDDLPGSVRNLSFTPSAISAVGVDDMVYLIPIDGIEVQPAGRG